jgi:hypothetical protein
MPVVRCPRVSLLRVAGLRPAQLATTGEPTATRKARWAQLPLCGNHLRCRFRIRRATGPQLNSCRRNWRRDQRPRREDR